MLSLYNKISLREFRKDNKIFKHIKPISKSMHLLLTDIIKHKISSLEKDELKVVDQSIKNESNNIGYINLK